MCELTRAWAFSEVWLGEDHFSIIIILGTNISHQHREGLSWSQTQIKMTETHT